jgi:hypothetical protein
MNLKRITGWRNLPLFTKKERNKPSFYQLSDNYQLLYELQTRELNVFPKAYTLPFVYIILNI